MLTLISDRLLDYVAACSAAAQKERGHVGRFWKEKEKRKSKKKKEGKEGRKKRRKKRRREKKKK